MIVFMTLLSMLAVWRATHMLQEEAGPFGVFARLQAWIASKPDKVGGLNDGFFCFYCLSMWVALPFAVILAHGIASFFIYWLALSAGALLVQLVHNVLDKLQ